MRKQSNFNCTVDITFSKEINDMKEWISEWMWKYIYIYLEDKDEKNGKDIWVSIFEYDVI